jgi:hypothetical protein
MSSVAEIESAVLKLPPKDLAIFAAWFESQRAALASAGAGDGSLRTRLQCLTREERRVLAAQAAEASARHCAQHPEDVIPDLVDEPA